MLIRGSTKPDAPVQALLCTDVERSPEHIVTWFVRRWCVETTFGEVRTRLGVETQRRWPDRATPCLLALFSIVTVLASCLPARRRRSVTATVWYPEAHPTFPDGLRDRAPRDLERTACPKITAHTGRRKIPFRLPQAQACGLCNAA